jgi:iron complex transport system substrate-binding protein
MLAGLAFLAACARKPGESEPRRIVSLSPSLTKMAFALGLGDRIVGVTQYDLEPESVRRLPRVGGFLDIDIETVAKLAPHLVLLSEMHSEARRKLESLGIPALELRTRSISEVRGAILALGRRTGRVTEASALVEKLERELAPQPCPARPRVLVTLGRTTGTLAHLVAAGPGTYLDELVTLCGGTNALPSGPAAYPAMGMERLVQVAPDVIIDLAPDGKPGPWHQVPFVKAPRIATVADSGFSTPGVDLGTVKIGMCKLICIKQ